MKLLRLKITDPEGFRSLPSGFECYFRHEWCLQDELARPDSFEPFVCAGPNGSGKSNLLEVLAAIFFQLEVLRVRRSFLPDVLQQTDQDFPPEAFELDYLIRVPPEYVRTEGQVWARVGMRKIPGESVHYHWQNESDFNIDAVDSSNSGYADILLPEYVLGYSSGENEILSLPFFKLRFVQFDEYWNALTRQLSYPGHPETRLAFFDNEFSQGIFLCNLLFQNEVTLRPFREDVGIESLQEFRIIIRRSIPISVEQLVAFASEDQNKHEEPSDIINSNPALYEELDEFDNSHYRLNLIQLLEGDEESSLMVSALKRCATLNYVDESNDTLVLDYWVNDTTKRAFSENFNRSPLALFQAFQVLLTLNLYAVSDTQKNVLYNSYSNYTRETVPTLASDQRIMRFKFVRFLKHGVDQPMMLKELSDGEHQLLHSLGLCLLFRNTNSLFLLDEPETHFNPDWRANLISRLSECLHGSGSEGQEMLITTHTPFLISDSKPDKVLVFNKDKNDGAVSITQPDYNTLGASINKITMNTFGKRETIGRHAQDLLAAFRARFESGKEDNESLIKEINQKLGDSVEKILLIKYILDGDRKGIEGAQD